MEVESTPGLTEAFPERLRSRAGVVLAAVVPQLGSPGSRSPDDVGLVVVNGERLRIPARIYNPEPDWGSVQAWGLLEESLVGCLYSRHHDGHVRERALAHIRTLDEPWVAAFVIQLLGEYVIEVVERAASLIASCQKPPVLAFLRENLRFLDLTTARATSYWNEYYRRRFPVQAEYPALMVLANLRALLKAA